MRSRKQFPPDINWVTFFSLLVCLLYYPAFAYMLMRNLPKFHAWVSDHLIHPLIQWLLQWIQQIFS